MGKGGGGKGSGGYGPKKKHGSKFGSMEDFLERNADEKVGMKPDEEEEAVNEGVDAKPKTRVQHLERDDELEAELAAQFDDGSGLTRKQKEELQAQEEARREQKEREKGSNEEAQADMKRLEEVRKRREEAAKEKERLAEEAKKADEEKAKRKEEKDQTDAQQRGVAVKVAELVAGAGGKQSLNWLNQDAACKKTLKPLCKKEGVKAINKAWLEKFGDLLKVEEEGKEIMISVKAGK